MWHAQIKELPSTQTRRELIEQALSAQSMTADGLIRKLGHINMTLGRLHLDALLQGEENRPLLRRVAALLHISTEELIGERVFTDHEEYQRFVFVPTLLRIPEKTTPNQIMPVALAGIDRFLCVGRYPEMLNIQPQYQDEILGAMIREDVAANEMGIFGRVVGYAFLPSYDDIRAYDTNGQLIPNALVNKIYVAAHSGIGSNANIENNAFICQLVKSNSE
ncbi:hypothetical protein [Pelovirga terrestris]|uniref:Uncharacterized protein n=1 Tax=Pelovirga terrestris TaxID=2771352 RepID=A0A8J6UQY1_9BACT|nr:hypothetical protein [Pelovirga terrestris]MBD1399991.1 hypothetical protein [Pelovirga terrestris]